LIYNNNNLYIVLLTDLDMQKKGWIILVYLLLVVSLVNFISAFEIGSGYCGDLKVDYPEQCDQPENAYLTGPGKYAILGCQPSVDDFLNKYGVESDISTAMAGQECTCREGNMCVRQGFAFQDEYFYSASTIESYFSPDTPITLSKESTDLPLGFDPTRICDWNKFIPSECGDSSFSCLSGLVPNCGNGLVENVVSNVYRPEECDLGWDTRVDFIDGSFMTDLQHYRNWIMMGCVPPLIAEVPTNASVAEKEEYNSLSSQINGSRPCTYIDQSNTTNTGCTNVVRLPICTNCPNGQERDINEYTCSEECACPNKKVCTSEGGMDLKSCTGDISSATAKIGYYLDESGNFGLGCNLNLFSSDSVTVNSLDLYDYQGDWVSSQSIGETASSSFSKNYLISDYSSQSDGSLAIMCVFTLSQTDSSNVCNNECQVNSQWSGDFDGDSYWGYERTMGKNCTIGNKVIITPSSKPYDCKDTIVEDTNSFYGFDKVCSEGIEEYRYASDKNAFCYADTNNDGIGDFANCSYCRNPSMEENADDIDNNCMGTCQGNTSRSCYLSEESYTGDGANDNEGKLSCSGVVNSWGVQDSFCQMVDDNVKTNSGEVCGGYTRAVKWGYMDSTNFNEPQLENVKVTADNVRASVEENAAELWKYCFGQECILNKSTIVVFRPGGIHIPSPLSIPITDFRYGNALIGKVSLVQTNRDMFFMEFVPDGGLFTEVLISFIGEKEGDGQTTRGTLFNKVTYTPQIIDSFRGEFNKFVKDKSGSYKEDTYFDLFWQINQENLQKKEGDEFLFKWETACVKKDKCTDGADNDGPKDIRRVPPFDQLFGKINLIQANNIEADISGYDLLSIPFFDMDDPSCKDRQDPYTQENYCIDNDHDGYCNNSKVFPDCYDSATVSDSFPLFAYNDVSPEDIHPFAEVNDTSCTQKVGTYNWLPYGLDRNCNKNGFSGLDDSLLFFGNTPYDNNLNTGMEYVNIMNSKTSIWAIFSGPSATTVYEEVASDQFCAHRPIGEDFDKAMYIFNTPMRLTLESFTFGGLGSAFSTAVEAGKVGRVVQTGAGFIMGGLAIAGGSFVFDTSLNVASNIASGKFSEDDLINVINSGEIVFGFFSTARGYISTQKQLRQVGSSSKLISVENKGNTGIEIATEIPKGSVINTPAKGTVEALKDLEVRPSGCFLENTSVSLANGSLINIEDLQVGASVVAFDLENNRSLVTTITATMIRDENKYRVVEYG